MTYSVCMRRALPRWIAVFAVLCAAHGTSALAQPVPRVEVPPAQRFTEEPLISYPGDVHGLQGVIFKIVSGYRPITLDLYGVADPGSAKPAVVWIHGGGWRQGGTRSHPGYPDWTKTLAGLAQRGFVVAAVDYRLSAEAPFPAAIQDVKDAIRWLRRNAAVYGIDPARVVVWGASSGAHLAALAGTSCDAKDLDDDAVANTGSACVSAVVDWFGPTDFALATQPTSPGAKKTAPSLIADMDKFLGCKIAQCPAATLRAVNPISYVGPHTPPFLILHGTTDETVPIENARALYDALRGRGVAAQMIAYPGLGHGFVGATTAQKQAILGTTFNFIEQQTKPLSPP